MTKILLFSILALTGGLDERLDLRLAAVFLFLFTRDIYHGVVHNKEISLAHGICIIGNGFELLFGKSEMPILIISICNFTSFNNHLSRQTQFATRWFLTMSHLPTFQDLSAPTLTLP